MNTVGTPAPATNYYALFGIEPAFVLDIQVLERAFRALQRMVHPDQFVGAAASAQRLALAEASLANEAYRTLKSPVERARHLLRLNHIDCDLDSARPSPAFLMRQMEYHEALAAAAGNAQALADFEDELAESTADMVAELARLLDEQRSYAEAAALVLHLQFFERLRVQLDAAFDRL